MRTSKIRSKVFSDPKAMQAWGSRLARVLKPGDVVALVGNLGAGKTTLVQGIAAGWGYKRRANSPTFALVNEYRSARGTLLHMDMYRLPEKELEAFPLDDYLDSKTACLIEWADRVQTRWPKETLQLRFKIASPAVRQVEIHMPSNTWEKRMKHA